MKARVRFNEGMQFVGLPDSGHSLLMDTTSEAGGFDSAPRPLELVLVGLGGCTGMDVISILRKMRVDFTSFETIIEAERREEHPKSLKKVNILYKVWGEVSEEDLTKAIQLSLEKYCPVANTLKPAVELEYEYVINPQE